MLITDRSTALTGDTSTLPRAIHGAGVSGYTHRYIPDDIAEAAAAVLGSDGWVDYVAGKNLAGTNRPTVRTDADGKYLEFDGTNDTILNNTLTVGDAITVAFVARARSIAGSAITGSSALANPQTTYTQMNAAIVNTTMLSTWRCVIVSGDGTNVTCTVDGATTSAAGTSVFGANLRVAANGTPANFCPLDIREIVTYNRLLTTDEKAAVRASMKAAFSVLS